jgi:hypothetical protein
MNLRALVQDEDMDQIPIGDDTLKTLGIDPEWKTVKTGQMSI